MPFSPPEPFDVPEGANPEVPRVSGPGRDSREAIDLEAWAAKLGTDSQHESYAVWARAKCDYVPAAWIRVLLERKVDGRSGGNRSRINLLSHILGQWMNTGECEFIKADPKPASVPFQRKAEPRPSYMQPIVHEPEPEREKGPPAPGSVRANLRELKAQCEAINAARAAATLPRTGSGA